MKSYLFLLSVVFLAGCASNVPEAVRFDVGEPISVVQAQQQGNALQGKPVRWGGEILAVLNHRTFSEVVVLRRGLFNDGEPKPSGGEAKRFIARFEFITNIAQNSLPAAEGGRILRDKARESNLLFRQILRLKPLNPLQKIHRPRGPDAAPIQPPKFDLWTML